MSTPRDQLIADWQNRLAAASEAPEEATSRAAWLVRLRTRLYHFLLSLYGEGNWKFIVLGAMLVPLSWPDLFEIPTPTELLTILVGLWAALFSALELMYLFVGLRRKSGPPSPR